MDKIKKRDFENLYSKFTNLELKITKKKKTLAREVATAASELKKLKSPQVFEVTYNKNNFIDNVLDAVTLSETEVEKLKSILKEEIKNAHSNPKV